MFYRIRSYYYKVLHNILGDWNYFLYDEHKQEYALIKKFYQENQICTPTKKLAIFMANGFCNHAGLSDRLKGIITVYGWCKRNHIKFSILHIHPFNLEDYLIPNQYNWHINKDYVCYNKKYTDVIHCMLNHLTNKLVSSGRIYTLEEHFINKRMKSKKTQFHFYTNMYPKDDKQFGELFRELFKPAPKVKNCIQQHLEKIGNSYVSISFRFMQLLGDFRDCEGEILNTAEKQKLIEQSLHVIDFVRKQTPNSKILITSDSISFLEAAKILPFVYVVSGKIGHINYEQSDDVNMKTFIDFFMIANANKVYLAKSQKMYNSDFARRASMIYNKQFEIIEY